MTKADIIPLVDRALEIEKEFDSLENIRLTSENIEDVDDVYQDKLEQGYYIDELIDEYKHINVQLGYHKRELNDKSTRRL